MVFDSNCIRLEFASHLVYPTYTPRSNWPVNDGKLGDYKCRDVRLRSNVFLLPRFKLTIKLGQRQPTLKCKNICTSNFQKRDKTLILFNGILRKYHILCRNLFVLLMYISANNHFIITFSILVYIACDTTFRSKDIGKRRTLFKFITRRDHLKKAQYICFGKNLK